MYATLGQLKPHHTTPYHIYTARTPANHPTSECVATAVRVCQVGTCTWTHPASFLVAAVNCMKAWQAACLVQRSSLLVASPVNFMLLLL